MAPEWTSVLIRARHKHFKEAEGRGETFERLKGALPEKGEERLTAKNSLNSDGEGRGGKNRNEPHKNS